MTRLQAPSPYNMNLPLFSVERPRVRVSRSSDCVLDPDVAQQGRMIFFQQLRRCSLQLNVVLARISRTVFAIFGIFRKAKAILVCA